MNEAANSVAGLSPKWTTVSWKRVVVALVLIFGCLGSLLPITWFLEPWYFAREMSRDSPRLSIVPTSLHETSRSQLGPSRLSVFEYSFQTPWTQIDRRRDSAFISVIAFNDGPMILAWNPTSKPNILATMRKESQNFERTFGQQAVSSRYSWMAAELAATPEQIHWWDRSGNLRAMALLGLKAGDTSDTSAIYKVGNNEVRGFQLGDPQVTSRVKLELFDAHDRQYELMISASDENGRRASQADINAIVASFRPIPHS